jgi:uncharacterized damage-inducible protein DinB
MDIQRAAFELNSRHTLEVVRLVPDDAWDRLPGGSAETLRHQLLHLALVRESICRQLAGESTAGLGTTFEAPEWHNNTSPLAEAFDAHTGRCRDLLARVKDEDLDTPFVTRFGNRSTPRNFLRSMLIEEVHHRAQMTVVLRLFGIEPPAFPGKAWVELGISQES